MRATMSAISSILAETMVNRIKRLHEERRVAIEREMSLEGQNPAAYRKALKEAEASEERLDALADEIFDRPVKTWDDVLLLAEVANAYGCVGDWTDPGIYPLTARGRRAVLSLVQAVRIVAKR